ncbi:hypothetical protein THAOC_21496, partial [Thalassiosira oceanica]
MADDSQPPDDAVSDERYLDDYGWWWLSSNPVDYSHDPTVPLPDCDLFRSALEKYWMPNCARRGRRRLESKRKPADRSSPAKPLRRIFHGRPGIPTPETIGQRAASSDSVAGPSPNEAASRRATPEDSGNPPPRVPTPATAEDQSAAGLRQAIDNLQNADELSTASSPPSTPLNPRQTGNDPRASNPFTPGTEHLLQELRNKMDAKTSPERKRINSFMIKLIRENESRPSRPRSKTPN